MSDKDEIIISNQLLTLEKEVITLKKQVGKLEKELLNESDVRELVLNEMLRVSEKELANHIKENKK